VGQARDHFAKERHATEDLVRESKRRELEIWKEQAQRAEENLFGRRPGADRSREEIG
jgi:hypothetical protein